MNSGGAAQGQDGHPGVSGRLLPGSSQHRALWRPGHGRRRGWVPPHTPLSQAPSLQPEGTSRSPSHVGPRLIQGPLQGSKTEPRPGAPQKRKSLAATWVETLDWAAWRSERGLQLRPAGTHFPPSPTPAPVQRAETVGPDRDGFAGTGQEPASTCGDSRARGSSDSSTPKRLPHRKITPL